MKRQRCPTCGRLEKRSLQANARYWLLLHLISEQLRPAGESYSAKSYHEYFKRKFLGRREVKLPTGDNVWIVNSSADLDTAEFNEFQSAVEAWAAEHDVYLQDLAAA